MNESDARQSGSVVAELGFELMEHLYKAFPGLRPAIFFQGRA